MDNDAVISVNNVTKSFKVFYDKGTSLKEKLLFWKRNRYEVHEVLKGISFDVYKGDALGIIGSNGCGKSTTLKLLTQIMYPDNGTVTVHGRVAALIELGAGFHPDMSGRENIYTNAAIFGLSKTEIDQRLQSIIDFSELGEYIDNPVRTYSSGMYMRLAFSVAINVDADILFIDEILAVGDGAFQTKCFNKLKEIKGKGTTIVIVSHSLGQIEEICNRTIWLNKGVIEMDGSPALVHEQYLRYLENKLRQGELLDGTSISPVNDNTHEDFPVSKQYVEKGSDQISLKEYSDIISYKTVISEKGTKATSEVVLPYSDGSFLIRPLLDFMLINECCIRMKEYILIKKGGILFGPYVSLYPGEYVVICQSTVLNPEGCSFSITSSRGDKLLSSVPLKNGRTILILSVQTLMHDVEFTIHNDSDYPVKCYSIMLV